MIISIPASTVEAIVPYPLMIRTQYDHAPN